jgi:hypothetical protein
LAEEFDSVARWDQERHGIAVVDDGDDPAHQRNHQRNRYEARETQPAGDETERVADDSEHDEVVEELPASKDACVAGCDRD